MTKEFLVCCLCLIVLSACSVKNNEDPPVIKTSEEIQLETMTTTPIAQHANRLRNITDTTLFPTFGSMISSSYQMTKFEGKAIIAVNISTRESFESIDDFYMGLGFDFQVHVNEENFKWFIYMVDDFPLNLTYQKNATNHVGYTVMADSNPDETINAFFSLYGRYLQPFPNSNLAARSYYEGYNHDENTITIRYNETFETTMTRDEVFTYMQETYRNEDGDIWLVESEKSVNGDELRARFILFPLSTQGHTSVIQVRIIVYEMIGRPTRIVVTTELYGH